jgi:tight adherence protein B
MPFVLILIINTIHPSYFGDVRHHPLFMPAIGLGLLLLACGNFVMYRMVNFKY